MGKFHYLQNVQNSKKDLGGYSPSYRAEKITLQMNIGRDVWIKYYAFDKVDNTTIEINGQEKYIGTPSIMMYISTDDETYDVYTYDGILCLTRITEDRVRQDIITNIDEVVAEFQAYLQETQKEK